MEANDTAVKQAVARCARPREAGARPVAMIVEDSPSAAGLLAKMLERRGYDSEIARNGIEGLAALKRTVCCQKSRRLSEVPGERRAGFLLPSASKVVGAPRLEAPTAGLAF